MLLNVSFEKLFKLGWFCCVFMWYNLEKEYIE